MKLRIALAAALLIGVIVSLSPLRTIADPPVSFYSQALTTTGNLPVIRLQGASSCTYTLAGTGAATVTPKASSDNGATYATDSNAGFGAQTANGIYGGAMIPASGTPYSTNFYVAVTGVTGTVTVTEACSGQVAQRQGLPGASGAPGTTGPSGPPGSPGSAANVVAGACISVTPTANPTGGQIVAYACASPTTAPSVAAGACIGITTPPAQGTVAYTCASPTTAPNIAVTSTPCGGVPTGGSFSVTVPNCTAGPSLPLSVANGGTGTSSPNPAATVNTCGSLAYSGTWPSQLLTLTNCTLGQLGGVTLQTAASPSPQAGYAALTGSSLWGGGKTALFIGPNPTPSASSMPDAIWVASNIPGSGCNATGSKLAAWGTNATTILGVFGALFSLGCPGTSAPQFNVDVSGNAASNSAFYGQTYQIIRGASVGYPSCGANCAGLYFSDSQCGWFEYSGLPNLYLHAYGGNRCSIASDNIANWNASSAMCTDSGNSLISCSAQTVNYGEVTCTISGTASCTATATVRSGARCQATYESTDTTAPLSDLEPISLHTASTTLTITMDTTVTLSATLAANYWCP
jgi:hypothetical protein